MKYFSKKNKNYDGPKNMSSHTGKTVEVFLFESKDSRIKETKKEVGKEFRKETKNSKRELSKKVLRHRSPLNKSSEAFSKKYKTKYESQLASFSYKSQTPMAISKKNTSKPKVCLSVYQKYINKIK